MRPADVATILEDVIDPELGIDIVSLGFLYGISVDDSAVAIDMTVTSPNCPMADAIAAMVANRLARSCEGREIALEMVTEPGWEIGMADRSALQKLGIIRN